MQRPDFWSRPAPTAMRAYQQAAQTQASVVLLAGARSQTFAFTRTLGVI